MKSRYSSFRLYTKKGNGYIVLSGCDEPTNKNFRFFLIDFRANEPCCTIISEHCRDFAYSPAGLYPSRGILIIRVRTENCMEWEASAGERMSDAHTPSSVLSPDQFSVAYIRKKNRRKTSSNTFLLCILTGNKKSKEK